jgi:hypothetical protein
MNEKARLERLIEAGLKGEEREPVVTEVNSAFKSTIESFEKYSGRRLDDEEVHILRFELEIQEKDSNKKVHSVSNRSQGFRLTSPFAGNLRLPWPFPDEECTWCFCIDEEIELPINTDEPVVIYIHSCTEIKYPCW